jgi:cytoskeletal protein CcmA (bactofilin family)
MINTIKIFKSTTLVKFTPSIFSEDLIIQGDITSIGSIEIKGKVKGNINGGSVVIRQGGKVEGQVNVDSLTLLGSFDGDLKVKTINISKGAEIIGKVKTL